MAELKRQRGIILGRLTRIEVFIRDIESKPGITADVVQVRLEVVNQCWVEYDTVQTAIDAEEEVNVEEEEEKRATFEDRCMNARAALRSIIDRMQGPARTAANVNSGQPLVPVHQQFPMLNQPVAVRLPTLELPTFSGDYMDWPAFRDAFEALIDRNTQLSDVQKLLYLKSTLKGEAACTLDAMDITDANYRVAWDLLVERFENRRVIKQKHLKALFNIKQVSEDSPKELRRLLTECQRNVNALKQLGEPTDQWSTILVYLIATKLDGTSRRDWETQTQDDETPTYEDIFKFINGRCHMLETLTVDKEDSRKSSRINPQLVYVSTSSTGCKICERGQNHPLWNCEKFIAMSPAARLEEVKKLKLCYNCFSSKHVASTCESRGCKSCSEKHNTLLHGSRQQHQPRQPEQHSSRHVSLSLESVNSEQYTVNASMASQAGHDMQSSSDILPTAMVCIYDQAGSKLPCRVLLDSGSQPNFITQDFAQKLRLVQSDMSTTVRGAEIHVGRQVTATIESRVNGKQFNVPLLVMTNITNVLPSSNIQCNTLDFEREELADPTFHKPGKIDVLLGAKLFFKLLRPEKVESGDLILWNSELGRIVSGSYKQCSQTHVLSNMITSTADANLLHHSVISTTAEKLPSEGNNEDNFDSSGRHFLEHVDQSCDENEQALKIQRNELLEMPPNSRLEREMSNENDSRLLAKSPNSLVKRDIDIQHNTDEVIEPQFQICSQRVVLSSAPEFESCPSVFQPKGSAWLVKCLVPAVQNVCAGVTSEQLFFDKYSMVKHRSCAGYFLPFIYNSRPPDPVFNVIVQDFVALTPTHLIGDRLKPTVDPDCTSLLTNRVKCWKPNQQQPTQQFRKQWKIGFQYPIQIVEGKPSRPAVCSENKGEIGASSLTTPRTQCAGTITAIAAASRASSDTLTESLPVSDRTHRSK